MNLEDECKPCAAEKSAKENKEYKELPESLCCVDEAKTSSQTSEAKIIKKKTVYCLRAYVRNMTNEKYCLVPPRGCT
jgi:hypothetical protein